MSDEPIARCSRALRGEGPSSLGPCGLASMEAELWGLDFCRTMLSGFTRTLLPTPLALAFQLRRVTSLLKNEAEKAAEAEALLRKEREQAAASAQEKARQPGAPWVVSGGGAASPRKTSEQQRAMEQVPRSGVWARRMRSLQAWWAYVTYVTIICNGCGRCKPGGRSRDTAAAF